MTAFTTEETLATARSGGSSVALTYRNRPKMLLPAIALIVCIAMGLVFLDVSIRERQLLNTVVSNAKVYIHATKGVRDFYISTILPVAQQAGIEFDMASHLSSGQLPLAYSALIDISEETYTLEEGGSRFVSDYSWREDVEIGPVDLLVWERIKSGETSAVEVFKNETGRRVVYAEPIYLEAQGCVDCHNSHQLSPKTDWQLGDLRGAQVIELALPSLALSPSLGGIGQIPFVWSLGFFVLISGIAIFLILKRANEVKQSTAAQLQSLSEHYEGQYLQSVNGLVRGVAHNFNNLMTVVLGSAEMMRAKGIDTPEVDKIYRSVKRGVSLVNKLLQYSNQERFELERICVAVFVSKRLPIWEDDCNKRQRHLDCKLEWNLYAFASEDQYEFIFSELLENSLRYSMLNSVIKIRGVIEDKEPAQERPGVLSDKEIVYTIENEMLPNLGKSDEINNGRAFEPFYTEDPSSHVGLGLSAIQGIVESLDGSVDMQCNESIVKVTIRLPLAAEISPS